MGSAGSTKGGVDHRSIVAKLRADILDGTIPPASRVNIAQLASQLAVSTTPVREALRELQGDNLLLGTSNKGYETTKTLDAQGVRALFEFRLLVEPWSARLAASDSLRNPSPLLRSEIQSFNSHARSMQQEMIDHDSRFHTAILQSSENSFVLDAYQRSHCHLHLFRICGNDWDWEASLNQHGKIADAIETLDPQGAEDAMKEHLQFSYLGFLNYVSEASGSRKLSAPAPARMVPGAHA